MDLNNHKIKCLLGGNYAFIAKHKDLEKTENYIQVYTDDKF